jgi:hypothetical protein
LFEKIRGRVRRKRQGTATKLLDLHLKLRREEDLVRSLLRYCADDASAIWPRKRLAEFFQSRQRWSMAARLYETVAGIDPANARQWHQRCVFCRIHAYESGEIEAPLHNLSMEETSQSIALLSTERELLDRGVHYLTSGLDDFSIATLEHLTHHAADKGVRADAASALCRWFLSNGAQPDRALGMLHALKATGEWRRNQEVLEVETLLASGEHSQALDSWRACHAEIPSDNTFLLGANLRAKPDASFAETANEDVYRLWWINQIFGRHSLDPLMRTDDSEPLGIDTITTKDIASTEIGPLVSVVIPVFNGGRFLGTALRSLARQSWLNLEILVADDASSDNTVAIAEAFAQRDPRFRVLRRTINAGPSAARNTGLAEASGEFFICHDSDDWSHPRKIERQVRALLSDPEAIGNASRCMTAHSDLTFTRRGNTQQYFTLNYSALMFRRRPVLDKIGYWDCARFGADAEYLERLRAAFGRYAVTEPDLGPLSIVRQSKTNRTADARHGLTAFGHTLRQEYRRRYRRWHATASDLQVGQDANKRPFAIPAQLLQPSDDAPVVCDVVVASDFRVDDIASRAMQIVRDTTAAGKKVGLLHISSPKLPANSHFSPVLDALPDRLEPGMIAVDQSMQTDLVIALEPPIEHSSALPVLTARQVVIVARNPLSPQDVSRCSEIARAMFGKDPLWIGENSSGPAAEKDWQAWWRHWLESARSAIN